MEDENDTIFGNLRRDNFCISFMEIRGVNLFRWYHNFQ